jgi:hypothetical protein
VPTLRERIAYWISQGYVVQSETPTSAQLIRKRHFNPAEFLAMPIYLLEFLGQRDKTLYLSVEPDGSVNEQTTALDRSAYRRIQDRSAATRVVLVVGGFVVFIAIVLVLQALTR